MSYPCSNCQTRNSVMTNKPAQIGAFITPCTDLPLWQPKKESLLFLNAQPPALTSVQIPTNVTYYRFN